MPKTKKHHPRNVERAGWARNALEVFSDETYGGDTVADLIERGTDTEGNDFETCIQDLITDLLHLAHQHGQDVTVIHKRGLGMFHEELAEPDF